MHKLWPNIKNTSKNNLNNNNNNNLFMFVIGINNKNWPKFGNLWLSVIGN